MSKSVISLKIPVPGAQGGTHSLSLTGIRNAEHVPSSSFYFWEMECYYFSSPDPLIITELYPSSQQPLCCIWGHGNTERHCTRNDKELCLCKNTKQETNIGVKTINTESINVQMAGKGLFLKRTGLM